MKLTQKQRRLILIIIAIFIALTAASYTLRHLNESQALIYKKIMYKLKSSPYQEFFQDGKQVFSYKLLDFNRDVKEIHTANNNKMLLSHTDAYAVVLPDTAKFDFSKQEEFIQASDNNIKIAMSREWSPYDDTEGYLRDYLHRFMLDPKYLEENKITLHKNAKEMINNNYVRVIALTRYPAPGSTIKNNTYFYAYVLTKGKTYYRIMFNTDKYDTNFIDYVYKVLYSFNIDYKPKGSRVLGNTYKHKLPDYWSAETKGFYNKLISTQKPMWGLFRPQAILNNKYEKIEKVEKKLDYKFDIALEYIYFGDDFPLEGMKRAYDNGKVVELTIQMSTVENLNLNAYNPNFDIYDGRRDEYIHKLAKSIKSFGKPIMLRLNNEMNSDWTTYGGPAVLNDPEIYKYIWRHMYDIFKAEGVNNTIWIFNPNDRNFPPCAYNSFIAYYPGDDYVQLIGVTGYNTGTYYKNVNKEDWRSFKEIYDSIQKAYQPYFADFPWIITEFSTSSVGGDKAKWILDMFDNMANYKNIKAAVWFSSYDLDTRPGRENIVSRPYWLDENEDSVNAFIKGLYNYKYKKDLSNYIWSAEDSPYNERKKLLPPTAKPVSLIVNDNPIAK